VVQVHLGPPMSEARNQRTETRILCAEGATIELASDFWLLGTDSGV
jgi:hypothetical protein